MASSGIEHNEGGGLRFQRDLDPARQRQRARLAAQAEQNRRAVEESDCARFWFAVRTAVICVAGCVTGFLPMAWAMHTTDLESAKIAWAAGPVIGQAIVLTTLIVAAIKWERDDW